MAAATTKALVDANPNEPPERDTLAGCDVRRLFGPDRDLLVREEPLILDVDGKTLLTMRSPGHDEELVTGFLVSEAWIEDASQIESLDVLPGMPLSEPGKAGEGRRYDRVRVCLSGDAKPRDDIGRVHEIRASCGICGIEDIDELVPAAGISPGPTIARGQLFGLFERMRERQRVFEATGGCHGAAIFEASGALVGFGEDVGRHNALDKAIGAAIRAGRTDFGECIGLLSGRAGYELVVKLLRLGVPIIASKSAASTIAFDLAREAGATLIGFARAPDLRVYWDEGRLLDDSASS